jgi:hypothetical protein
MTTQGEYRVGIDFNPSGDDMVGQIKRAAADLIDLVGTIDSSGPMDGEKARLKALAQTHIEDAAMWAVKAATKKAPPVAFDVPAAGRPDESDPFLQAVREALASPAGQRGADEDHIRAHLRRRGFLAVADADLDTAIATIKLKG